MAKKVTDKGPRSTRSSKKSKLGRVKSSKNKARRRPSGQTTAHRRTSSRKISRTSSRKPPLKKQDMLIRRSSGRKEKFDTDRLAQTVGRSGVPYLMARDIAKTATRKIKSHVKRKQAKNMRNPPKMKSTVRSKPIIVKANEVRNIVSHELRVRNRPDIATSYNGSPPEHSDLETKPNLNDKEPVLDIVAANMNKVLHDPSKQKGSA